MSVVRWNPVHDFRTLQHSMDRFLDRYTPEDGHRSVFPVDVFETPDAVIVRADLPGVNPDDVQVHLHQGQLYIRATRRAEAPEGATPLLQELGSGEVVRSFSLSIPVDPERVQASFTDGVLEVHLQKAEDAKPRRIPVARGAAGAALPATERTGAEPTH